MLQLQTKAVDICGISKLLVKYNIKASITNSVITLDGDISEELLTELLGGIDINAAQNFISNEPLYVPKEVSFAKGEELIFSEDVKDTEKNEAHLQEENAEESKEFIQCATVEETKKVANGKSTNSVTRNIRKYDLIYSEVKRGEVYWCDFGEPYGHEQGGERPAIIVQNDIGNLYSPTTIVIMCTTEYKKQLPVHYHFLFSSEIMVDYDSRRISSKENIILAEQIRTVDKTRLRKYIGTLTPEFMKVIEGKIDISLQLSREVKTIDKKIYVDKTVSQKAMDNSEAPKERKDVNMVQVQLLSFVDINKLNQISQANFNDEIKAQKILELFGFDFHKNGVKLLLEAIIASPKDTYFNLETLSEKVSKKEGVEKEEVMRLIVARVKERFGFKKAPTIDFIRLINSFLLKEENQHEETHI